MSHLDLLLHEAQAFERRFWWLCWVYYAVLPGIVRRLLWRMTTPFQGRKSRWALKVCKSVLACLGANQGVLQVAFCVLPLFVGLVGFSLASRQVNAVAPAAEPLSMGPKEAKLGRFGWVLPPFHWERAGLQPSTPIPTTSTVPNTAAEDSSPTLSTLRQQLSDITKDVFSDTGFNIRDFKAWIVEGYRGVVLLVRFVYLFLRWVTVHMGAVIWYLALALIHWLPF